MRLTQILQPETIKVPLEATDKQGAVEELIDLLAQQGLVHDTAALSSAVWQREKARTTGIGHGIAIPHGKTETLDSLHMAIGISTVPLDFAAIDSKPVTLIMLLASPANQTGPHILALQRISRMLIDTKFRKKIKNAQSARELYQLLDQRESEPAP